jgi:exodeoxyribonuclease VII small subunit
MAKTASSAPAEKADIPADILKLSFEAALKELEAIVQRLEQGQVDLEESIAVYSRGVQLKRHCENKLKAAEQKIEKIVIGAEGEAVGTTVADRD